MFLRISGVRGLLVLLAAFSLSGLAGCGGGGENQVNVSESSMSDEELDAYSAEADALNTQ